MRVSIILILIINRVLIDAYHTHRYEGVNVFHIKLFLLIIIIEQLLLSKQRSIIRTHLRH